MNTEQTRQERLETLRSSLETIGELAVAFSGGVDSSFLLAVAHEMLGERVVAFTISSILAPTRELRDAQDFCTLHGVEQALIELTDDDLACFATNPPNRCYLCKRVLFERIIAAAAARGIAVVAEGSNLDDESDYRPGRVALAELGVRSPLKDAGLTKEDIRLLSRELGLATWNKPSSACLATRLPYGAPLTDASLRRIDAAESLLIAMGVNRVRVRAHDEIARIECDESGMELFSSRDFRRKANEALKALGFAFVTLDLGGFVSGSMNNQLFLAP